MKDQKIFRLFAFSWLLLSLIGGCKGGYYGDITPPPVEGASEMIPPVPLRTSYPIFSPDPEKGAIVYDQWCARCHGNSGLGNGPEAESLPLVVPSISEINFLRESNLVEWYTIVSQGHSDRFMPAFFDNLSDREIWDVLTYVYSIGIPARLFEEGHLIYLVNCQDCHGQGGAGDGLNSAKLSVSLPDWSDPASLAGYSDLQIWKRVTAGNGNEMPAFIDVLDDDQRWAVTSFVRSMGFSNSRAFFESRTTPVPEPEVSEFLQTQTPDKIEVYGKIRNGSEGDIPLGTRVTLQVFQGNQPVLQRSAIMTSDGNYRFSDVDFYNDRIYLVSVLHEGLLFNSQVVRGSDIYPKESVELPITIYGTTTNVNNMRTERVHVFINFSQSATMRIVELYTISNMGKEVIVPENNNQPNLIFTLPRGAINLQLQNNQAEDRFVLTSDGFGEFADVFPSPIQHQVMYRYDLPYDQKKTIQFIMPMDIQSAVLAIPAEGVAFESDKLTPSGQRTLEGLLMQLYVANNIQKGEIIEVTISGKPGSTSFFGLSEYQNIIIGLVVLLPVLTVFLIWLISNHRLVRKKKIRQEDIEYEKAALLDDIVALDDLYRANQLALDVYRNRRNEILHDLKEILKYLDPDLQ